MTMLSGGKPPPGAGSPRKVYVSTVQAELEALRQRGLATILNKHFTEETKKLAAEKAAADAALRDLEERKARTSEFHASNGEISPLDSLYLSVNNWRKECRRKERETLLLYQRYVNKFGATGQVQVPFTTPKLRPALLDSPQTCDGSPPTSAPPPSNRPPPPPSSKVPDMAAAIESTLEEYLRKGAVSLPSVETLGKEETYQSSFSKEEAEFRNYYRRLMEERGVDARAKVPVSAEKHHHALATIGEATPYEDHDTDEDEAEEVKDRLGPLNSSYIHDDDNDSIISGITFNSAVTREIFEDCERTVATFLKEEHQMIRKMIEEEEAMTAMESHQDMSDVGSVSKQAAEEAENMVKQMQEILDDFQAKCTPGGDKQPDAVSADSSTPRRYQTSNPDEDWVIHYDEFYKREYYHETKSNRTQWEPPDLEDTSQSSPVALDILEESSSRGGLSRKALYRRRRRRQRKRRALACAALTLASTMGGAYYLYTHQETPASKLFVVQLAMPIVNKIVAQETVESKVDAMAVRVVATLDWMTGQAAIKAEQARIAKEKAELELAEERKRIAMQEAERKSEAERKAKEAAERKVKQEADRKAKQEAERKARVAAEEERKVKEEARRREQELEKARLAAMEEEERERNEAFLRRIGGTVPLAYFVEDLGMMTKYE